MFKKQQNNKVICPKCGKLAESGARFCPPCGASLDNRFFHLGVDAARG